MKHRLLRNRGLQRVLCVAAVVAMTSTSGCRLFDDIFGDESYRGVVSFGFEVVAFTPCRGSEQWWMTGNEELTILQSLYFDLVEHDYELVFAELKGEPSRRGEYGHLGAYQREFEVTDVIEIRPLEEGECGQ